MRRVSQMAAVLALVLTAAATAWAQGAPAPASPPTGVSLPDPATLMPPSVLLYAEIGSPGEQVEKIVAMLKGTPLANPLAALGGGRRPAPTTGPAGSPRPSAGKTPADIAAALLNPAMLEEFKKIRGLAVGMTGLPPRGNGTVPVIAILYPGQSDALRGLLTAGLLMTGQQGEPIEGLQTVVMDGGNGIMTAYDNDVFLCAASAEQLKWCVRQYKGAKQPSLAGADKSFARLTSAPSRRKDALTVWADPAALFMAFRETMSGGRVPGDLAIAGAILDFDSLEGAVLRLVLDNKSPFVEATASYRDGHRAVGYDLLRTPALSKEGFEAVPPDAVGVLAFALGEAQAPSAKAREALSRLTGLDIGRELFANIEQVNLFLMPVTEAMTKAPLARQTAPFVPGVGLVLTSKDPQRTKQLLEELLSLPQTVVEAERSRGAAMPARAAAARKPGEYLLPVGSEGVRVYVGQAGRSTVLALDASVLSAALSAAGASPADRAKGPLGAELARLPAGTCKLVLVNAGGAVRAYAAMSKVKMMPRRAVTQPGAQAMFDKMAKLAEALSGTCVMLNSVEGPNRVTVRLSASNLPPVADVFSLLSR